MKWYPKHFDRATELLNEGCSYQVVADTLTEEFKEAFSYHAVRQKVRNGEIDINRKDRYYNISKTTKDNSLRHVNKQAETRHFHWKEWSKEIQKVQSLKGKAGWSQSSAEAEIKSKKPIIVQFIGDLHFGSSGADYKVLEEITKRIQSIDNLYVVLLGDVVDNFFNGFRTSTAVFGQVMTPEEQLYFIESWLNDISDKLIATTWGNHDAWYEGSRHGYNPLKSLQAKHCPYFNGIGRINLKLNDIYYTMCVSHFFKGNSQWNPLHPMIKYSALQGGGKNGMADIYAQGHIHEPALQQQYMHGKLITYLRCGTLKVEDGYSARYFTHNKYKVDFPSVLLDHKKKHVVPYLCGEDALEENP